jgi:DNA polymerase-3 subunit epsilon
VVDAPKFEDIYPELREIVYGAVIVGYNMDYDSRVLTGEVERHGLEPLQPKRWIDVMLPLARYYGDWNGRYNSFKWKKLTFLADWLEVKVEGDAHSAIVDCQLTLEVMKAVVARKE